MVKQTEKEFQIAANKVRQTCGGITGMERRDE
jgi:hypothetical protein